MKQKAADLKEIDHPLGWLLTVLQQESADIEDLISALQEAVPHVKHLPKALAYLILLIIHQRPAEEHEELIRLVDQHAPNMEVEKMAKSMADVLREEGIEQGELRTKREDIIKLLQIRFDNVPEVVTQRVNRTRSLSRLNSLFEKAATIDSIDEFDEENQKTN